MDLDLQILEQLVLTSLHIKSKIVIQDEQEQGERRKLNFGHTMGHAIEKTIGLPHGEAVSLGMVFSAAMSEKMGLFHYEENQRLVRLLNRLKLPTQLNRAPGLSEVITQDKKRQGDQVHFVLLQGLGRACGTMDCIGGSQTGNDRVNTRERLRF
ncbi:MAG: hypothetical protein K9J81_04855 [Desulfohalobiaceae bacterium]|nr:hypothetical protein [Desulfohalobiaceae bacterium]